MSDHADRYEYIQAAADSLIFNIYEMWGFFFLVLLEVVVVKEVKMGLTA